MAYIGDNLMIPINIFVKTVSGFFTLQSYYQAFLLEVITLSYIIAGLFFMMNSLFCRNGAEFDRVKVTTIPHE